MTITVRTVYMVKNVTGEVVAKRVRIDNSDGTKNINWMQPDGAPGLNGTPAADLPLYGEHELDEAPMLVAMVEGEKARDALAAALANTSVCVVGTVTGAGGTPSAATLEVLRGCEVVLWPDADKPGREHMDRIAERLQGTAALVRVYDWPEAKDKGDDAADHPAVISGDEKVSDRLLDDLCGAPEYVPPTPELEPVSETGLFGRVMLGDLLKGGIERTPQLIEGLLYEGRIHSIAGSPGAGKTIVALWASIQVMKQGQPVLYLDAENGPKLIAERLGEMGAAPDDLNDLFHYYTADGIKTDKASVSRLLSTVEEAGAALVIFDSFADLLSEAGLEENSNDDCTLWMRKIAQPVKDTGAAVLILDHVPKNGKGPRGGGSKRAKVDVQWELDVKQQFNRERTGEIKLEHDKDRECWLPKIVRISVGGGVFARRAGTIEGKDPETKLTEKQGTVLELVKKGGVEGVRWSDLKGKFGGSTSTLSNAIGSLIKSNLIEKDGGRYYEKTTEPQKPIDKISTNGSGRFDSGSTEPNRTDKSGGVRFGSPPLEGEPTEPEVEPSIENDYNDPVNEKTRGLAAALAAGERL